jgi:predicted RNA-binding Zn-ribbon protein involved in translation (DUF1610 family)
MPETLISARCPVCGYTGDTDADLCPDCGHGLVSYRVERA